MELIIKKANEKDIDIIIDLAKIIWLPTYAQINSEEQNNYMFSIWYSQQGIKNQMIDGQTFYLAKLGEKNIGYFSFSKINVKEFKLNKIYLILELQGKGFGKTLLNLAEKEVVNLGATYLMLNVNRHNKAYNFYLSQGYKIIAEEDIAFGKFWMNDFVMRKEL